MRTLTRLIVMWLIALALPIQGVAAATLLHCGSTPPGAAAVSHGHEGHPHHRTEAQAKDAGASPLAHPHAGGKSSCSACASCCSAAALPAMPIVLASQDVAESVFAAPGLPVAVFLTDGPERPPRASPL